MSSTIDKALAAVISLQEFALGAANPALFALRRRIAFARGGYQEAPESGEGRSEGERKLLANPRAAELAERYNLDSLRPHLNERTWLTQLFYLDLLETLDERFHFAAPYGRPVREASSGLPHEAVPKAANKTINLLEVGAKNFESAPALHRFFSLRGEGRRDGKAEEDLKAERDRRAGLDVRLTGIELDAYRIYRGWHSRADYAHYYLGLLGDGGRGRDGIDGEDARHRYIAGDVMTHDDRYEVIAWFHPFLDAYPLLRWGLPKRYLKPEVLFDHILGLLRPCGVMIVVNQEAHEKEIQIEMFESRGLRFDSLDIDYTFTRTKPRGYAHVVYAPDSS